MIRAETLVDLLGSATAETYESVLPHVLADSNVDAVIALFVPPVVAGAEDVAAAVVRAIDELVEADKPVLTVFISLQASRRPGGLLVSAIGRPGAGPRGGARADWLRRRREPRLSCPASTAFNSSKAGILVNGFRGAPASDADALADLVLRLAQLADDFPEIAELDLNPVLGLRSGYVAVDARIKLRQPEARLETKTW